LKNIWASEGQNKIPLSNTTRQEEFTIPILLEVGLG